MKRIFAVWLTVAASLTALATDDVKEIQGIWQPAKGELAGQRMAGAVLKMIRLKLDHGKHEAFVGEHSDRGTYALDATAKPRCITVVGTKPLNKGNTFLAIYGLKGRTLRNHYDLSGVKRPEAFKISAGTQLYLVTYQRSVVKHTP